MTIIRDKEKGSRIFVEINKTVSDSSNPYSRIFMNCWENLGINFLAHKHNKSDKYFFFHHF